MNSVFTIDVEDWFHIMGIPSAPSYEEWDKLPSCVESNFLRLLDMLDYFGVKSTCFFLGYIAKRYPNLVVEADKRGHEIASHGFYHRSIFDLTPKEFQNELAYSQDILQQITGKSVLGFRAPAFTVDTKNTWFYEILIDLGFKYDSSVFPARRLLGGLRGGNVYPYRVNLSGGSIVEFPITVVNILGLRICFFGGGYLRLFPYSLIRMMGKKVLRENRPIIFYIHPREIDPYHKRMKMNIIRYFMSYINLKSTESKIRNILEDFKFVTFREIINSY